VPDPSKPLRRLGFLTIGLFDGADPAPGPALGWRRGTVNP
jgi:hypothetical protein